MTYATKQDLIDRFTKAELLELTDPEGTGVPDAAKVARALADAAAEIDSYIAKQYQLPISPVPAVLTAAQCNIARYHLFADQVTEVVEARYKAAVAWLKDVAAGKAKLDAAGVEPASADADVAVIGPGRVFSRDSMDGY